MGLQRFFDGVRRAAGHAVGLGGNRLELFGIEWREEIERQMVHLVCLLLALVFAGLALLLASVLMLILFWDTHRIAVAIGLMLAYAALATICALVLRQKLRDAPTPFAVTLDEFQRDRAALLRKSGGEA